MRKTLQEYKTQYESIQGNKLPFETWLFFEWMQDNGIRNIADEASAEYVQQEPQDMQEALITGFQNVVQYLRQEHAGNLS